MTVETDLFAVGGGKYRVKFTGKKVLEENLNRAGENTFQSETWGLGDLGFQGVGK